MILWPGTELSVRDTDVTDLFLRKLQPSWGNNPEESIIQADINALKESTVLQECMSQRT